MSKVAYLMFVDGSQNRNKYYRMSENDDGTFTALYGREGSSEQKAQYPISQWDKKLNEKLKKGYKDVTDFRVVKKIITDQIDKVISNDNKVTELIKQLQSFALNLTNQIYKVEAKEVTQAQVDAAQKSIDNLSNSLKRHFSKNWDVTFFNNELEKLYTIIPRKMKKVSEHLISSSFTKKEIEEMIESEQSNLDAMASQITSADESEKSDNNTQTDSTLLDDLGLIITIVTDNKELKQVKELAQNHAHRIKNVYKVVNSTTQKLFDNHISKCKNKFTKLLWHGSRNANWMSILQKGLMIRPSNAVITGAMFGNGVYGAIESDKSMGYTDNGRWVNGKASGCVFMALYDFHLGSFKEIHQHDSKCYNLHDTYKTGGYDSVWAKKGPSLRRDEIIVYSANQTTIKYLVEFSA